MKQKGKFRVPQHHQPCFCRKCIYKLIPSNKFFQSTLLKFRHVFFARKSTISILFMWDFPSRNIHLKVGFPPIFYTKCWFSIYLCGIFSGILWWWDVTTTVLLVTVSKTPRIEMVQLIPRWKWHPLKKKHGRFIPCKWRFIAGKIHEKIVCNWWMFHCHVWSPELRPLPSFISGNTPKNLGKWSAHGRFAGWWGLPSGKLT